jgi:hypothetical protein
MEKFDSVRLGKVGPRKEAMSRKPAAAAAVTAALLQPVMRKVLEDFRENQYAHRAIANRAIKDVFGAIKREPTWSFQDNGVMGIAAVAAMRCDGISESVRMECCYAILALGCVLNIGEFDDHLKDCAKQCRYNVMESINGAKDLTDGETRTFVRISRRIGQDAYYENLPFSHEDEDDDDEDDDDEDDDDEDDDEDDD